MIKIVNAILDRLLQLDREKEKLKREIEELQAKLEAVHKRAYDLEFGISTAKDN